MNKISLAQVQERARGSEEDWYIQFNGESYGYLYRCTEGFAVGIGAPEQEVKYSSIEPSKEAAIEYAQKHLDLFLQERSQDKQ